MKSFSELVKKSRSVRRFDESRALCRAELEALVDLARYAPSAANRQPLKYFLSYEKSANEKIFPCLGWVAYLAGWPGPPEGQRPAGYIVIFADRSVSETVIWDHSIAAQTILLGAADIGLGGCIIGAIDKKRLRDDFAFDERFDILLVLALGMPDEKIVIEPLAPDGDIKYYRDEQGVHHIPKRSLRDIILN